jgi:uncharacterized protein YhfF
MVYRHDMGFPKSGDLRTLELGTPGEFREHLVDLVLHGDKRATAGLLAEYEEQGEPPEHVGERLALVDSEMRQVGTIVVTKAVISRCADVPDDFALAEGEGDLDADDFRASHRAFWSTQGIEVTDDTLLTLIYFDLEHDPPPEG